jgi:hypothetical protein
MQINIYDLGQDSSYPDRIFVLFLTPSSQIPG